MNSNDIIINIQEKEHADCFICLNNTECIKMKCCKNNIHKKCLFEVFLNKFKTCPMCRQEIIFQDYFTKISVYSFLQQMSWIKKFYYNENIIDLFYGSNPTLFLLFRLSKYIIYSLFLLTLYVFFIFVIVNLINIFNNV